MSPRRQLAASAIARQPRLIWEAFVDLLVSEQPERMSELQCRARLALVYDREVARGGHRRFFESDAVFQARETIRALDQLGSWPQARLLETGARAVGGQRKAALAPARDVRARSSERRARRGG
jgi:hypothetical protein